MAAQLARKESRAASHVSPVLSLAACALHQGTKEQGIERQWVASRQQKREASAAAQAEQLTCPCRAYNPAPEPPPEQLRSRQAAHLPAVVGRLEGRVVGGGGGILGIVVARVGLPLGRLRGGASRGVHVRASAMD